MSQPTFQFETVVCIILDQGDKHFGDDALTTRFLKWCLANKLYGTQLWTRPGKCGGLYTPNNAAKIAEWLLKQGVKLMRK